MTNPIGAHVSGGKDLSKALVVADELKLEVVQVFLNGPTSFRFTEVDPAIDATFKEKAQDAGVRVFVHGPYLMNFGASKDATRWAAVELLRKNVERATVAGAEGVVLHAGSSNGDSCEEGLARVRETLLPLLNELPEDSCPVLLEPMAGQGSTLSSTVDSIPAYFEAVGNHEKFALCLDTAHLLAAGEPLDEEGGITQVLDRVGALVGFDRIKLIHANDSKVARGAKKDRHENLGRGLIGPSVWGEIFAHSGVVAPLVLETPGEGFSNDLEVLRTARG